MKLFAQRFADISPNEINGAVFGPHLYV